MTFQLRNDPLSHKPWRGEAPEKAQQKTLFAGLDCLSGQQDLFATDGTEYESTTTLPKECHDD